MNRMRKAANKSGSDFGDKTKKQERREKHSDKVNARNLKNSNKGKQNTSKGVFGRKKYKF